MREKIVKKKKVIIWPHSSKKKIINIDINRFYWTKKMQLRCFETLILLNRLMLKDFFFIQFNNFF